MNRYKWAMMELKWLGIRSLHALTGTYYVNQQKFAGVGMTDDLVANDFIYNGLMGDAPFAVAKTGFGEIGYMCCAQNEMYYNSRIHYYWTPSYITAVKQFEQGNDLQRFHAITSDAMNKMDAIGTYLSMFMVDAVLETLTNINNIMVFCINVHERLGEFVVPWTQALAGKKVLIVSPFCREIEYQYSRKDLIWPDGRLPDCHMEYDPSVWIHANGENSGFFRSLDMLSDRILSRDFDVALLSCGSIGIPVAARIKEAGKKAVHLGGAMHLLFGLKGKRWDHKGVYNEYWIRPGESTKPSNADELDGATYW